MLQCCCHGGSLHGIGVLLSSSLSLTHSSLTSLLFTGTSIPKKDDAVALNEFVLVSSLEGALFSSLPLFSLEKQQVVDVQDVKREGEELLRKQGLQSNVVLRMARCVAFALLPFVCAQQ